MSRLHWLRPDDEVTASFLAEPAPATPLEGDGAPPLEPDLEQVKWLADAPGTDEVDWSTAFAGVTERSYTWVARATGTSNEDGTTDFVASTGSVDRVGDVIDQASWRLASFRQNPVILYEHGCCVVGRAVKVGIADDGSGGKRLTIKVLWDIDESNPSGVLVAHQHAAGFRSACSVGFLPGAYQSRTELAADHPFYVDPNQTPRWRAGYLYTRCELLEVSSVAVPANREALQLSMAARQAAKDGDLLAAAKTLIRGVAPARTADELVDAFRTDPRFKALVAAMVLGERQGPPNPNRGPDPTKSQGPSWFERS